MFIAGRFVGRQGHDTVRKQEEEKEEENRKMKKCLIERTSSSYESVHVDGPAE